MRFNLPPFYTIKYVEVHNPTLSALWLLIGGAIVLSTVLGSLLGKHRYTVQHTPKIDVTFWQDYSTDGHWWPKLGATAAPYCNTGFKSQSDGDNSWGSEHIACKRPGVTTREQIFYASSNELRIATSVAYGTDPQYNTSEVFMYEGIEKSTVMFKPSYITATESVEHAEGCQAIGIPTAEHPDGVPLVSRYNALYPNQDYGPGYLMLSVADIIKGVGLDMDDAGDEKAMIRLAGLEIVMKIDVRNYHRPYRWPSDEYNPFGLTPASLVECRVKFELLRNQFTAVKWFYEKTEPIALQHGIRLSVVGSGIVGKFSFFEMLTTCVVSLGMFSLAQIVLDFGWYYLYDTQSRDQIADRAYERLELDGGRGSGEKSKGE